ncbi:hypothetical protein GH714_038851 [Hevea brasiliensis]|uniref:LIM zinc-binding domain-containing protein n=1 Tax=Hevea brasiliensis TaxID=3981 RepID=A0A6A6MNT7_HEVBR|nr:hypothetical protein GH714_038851 [Hevea brasiliensis]
MDIGGGSWDKETVTRALWVAYNNPERAVDHLYSDIPEAAEVVVPVAHFPTGQATEIGKTEKQNDASKVPSKVSSLFSGTQDKCSACGKTVYPLEKVTLEGECFHKSCFRCAHGGCPLTHSSYAALDGVLYCKHHFAQLFMEKGSYSHVLQAASHKRTASSTPPPELAEPEAEGEGAAAGDN